MEAHDRRAREELAYTLLTDGSRPVDTYLWHEATAQITEAPPYAPLTARAIMLTLATAMASFVDAGRSVISDDELLIGMGAFVAETWRVLIEDHPTLQAELHVWISSVAERITQTSGVARDGVSLAD